MKYTHGVVTGVLGTLLVLATGAAAYWLLVAPGGSPPQQKLSAPASVGKILKEDQLTTLRLTPEAEERLGIACAPIEVRTVQRCRVYGGEIMVPLGRTIPVSAPVGGTLRTPDHGMPSPGSSVKKGDPILQLSPLLTPEARASLATTRIDADGQVETTRTQTEAAKLALDRARSLLTQGAGNRESLEIAQAAYDIALKNYQVARSRKDTILRITTEVERGTGQPITLEAPADGILRSVSVMPGQNVHSGGQLFEVVDLQSVWIRVPVYVGELSDLRVKEPVAVGELSSRPGRPTQEAVPVVAPPSANALAATTDLFYQMPNARFMYSPGQRVGVCVPIQGEQESPTIPWSAVIHDIHGGTWVYEKSAPNTYIRQRVVVRHVQQDRAVLASGPPVGAAIVIAGAAELFGTEVGFSK